MNQSRQKKIIQTSIIGIITNIALAIFKAIVGLISGSIAITLDAVNNLSDALSSLITIIGTKLAGKEPDKKHPLGYGRIEYLSASIISVIVLYAGITSLQESIKKIVHPETATYSIVTLLIIFVAIIVKIVLVSYVKKVGQTVDSDALVASGQDALNDSIVSTSTLVAAILYLFCHISIEAWLGVIIAIVIIKSGFEMLRDTISEILGERIDADISQKVKASIETFDRVQGAYDLIIHNYGPDRLIGSVHIEVPSSMTAKELDTLERHIAEKTYKDTGVILTGISIYSQNVNDESSAIIEADIRRMVMSHPHVLQMHGFYLDNGKRQIRFDIIIDFDVEDRHALYQEIVNEVKRKYPIYSFYVQLDADISD